MFRLLFVQDYQSLFGSKSSLVDLASSLQSASFSSSSSSSSSTCAKLSPHLLVPRKCAKKFIFVIAGYQRQAGQRWSESEALRVVEQFDSYKQEWRLMPPIKYPVRRLVSHGIVCEILCILGFCFHCSFITVLKKMKRIKIISFCSGTATAPQR